MLRMFFLKINKYKTIKSLIGNMNTSSVVKDIGKTSEHDTIGLLSKSVPDLKIMFLVTWEWE